MTATLPRLAWSPREVGKSLGLPYETVLDLIHAGTLPAIKVGRHYRIPDDELRAYLKTAKAA